MFAILQKEINSFLNSMIAYIVIGVFLVAIGLFMWVFPETSVLEYGYADMQTLFSMAPWVFLFLIPAITMRSFSEEKKAGTLELLLTKPITDLQLILGKYFACLLLVIFSLVPTLLYYYSVYSLGNPEGNIDSAAVTGSYIGLVFLAAIFTAIGVFSSAITENQIVSFILAVFLSFLIYIGFDYIATIEMGGDIQYIISSLGISFHYNALSKGLIDSRDILYFLSVIVLLLLGTKLVLESRKW
ncbi:gliding motility-associated ABC transporter permease subunit GldF [Adhaeribacter rhizoryzae]|uniref:Gliding motility-associated ABC transporter permease subunit GldF n=1 Tax=Adhaeribacter rhizoryzae TaxID=2607907 RepID=A0A5M6DEF5_9BACT|nr:gliding motility-associated ABC transporter permease subunit GldF [Adhaeribacter rhizoryzae]KAA5544786.1 gliding motility-associated ABC transporter permease subunit GldF [Adhaeribacter rhizoryzae]